MVARGDLGVELSPEQVPVVQKEIIGSCRLQQTPVIVATEMLQSMVDSTRPTRAEASDVAAAVFEGADAVMLSAETAIGKHPREACSMMARIIEQAEASRFYAPPPSEPGRSTREAIAHAACNIAREMGARVLVAFTESGMYAAPDLEGAPGRADHRVRQRRGEPAAAGALLGCHAAAAGASGDAGRRRAGRPSWSRRCWNRSWWRAAIDS